MRAFDAIHHPDFTDFSPSGRAQDRAGFRQGILDLYAAFPDFDGQIDDLVLEPERGRAAIRWSAAGTHRGAFLGVAPGGRRIRFAGIEIIEIRDGQVIARWGEWDGLDILAQLDPARSGLEHGIFAREHPARDALGTLLFLHGLGSWGRCFDPVVGHPGLARFRKLLPDLPGCGLSPHQAEPLSFVDMADALAAWLRARGEERAIVVGHSLGGVLGTLLAERSPDLVLGLVDVEGNIAEEDCSLSAEVAAQPLEGFLAGGFAGLLDGIYRAGLEDEILRDYYTSLRLCDPSAYFAYSVELVALSAGGELASRLAALDLPVAYLAGSPRGAGRRSREMLEKAGIACKVIEPAGHVPFAEQPDLFVQVLSSIAAQWCDAR
ncbi:MAG: alpha/beta fold hydrolase [Deltaproteobacteria bacterium]|nr:alpha/beta fold hydrolase [Deltaproteobacteria bacterium]